ncbi:MAG: hydrogenase maturation nickel metallochaperone HypA [Candidatus Eisenbacteria bacterium]|nr:hydrogenase maturation nickel metallochaperone HypA [Candidatus Eisenbacteria bacterium]
MHEASVAEAILDIARLAASGHPGARIVRVNVRVGAFAHIDDEALRFAFDVLKEGTASSGAALEIERERLQGRCSACGTSFEAGSPENACPGCGSFEVYWSGDGGSRVVSIDVDDGTS